MGSGIVEMNGFSLIAVFMILLRSNYVAAESSQNVTRDPWRGLSIACTAEDPKNSSISCHGVRIVKRVIQQLLDSATSNIEITDGVRLVDSEDGGAALRRARKLKGLGNMGSILGFLEGKELRVKLPSLLPENLENAISISLPKGMVKFRNESFTTRNDRN